jgi:hypothetical protein
VKPKRARFLPWPEEHLLLRAATLEPPAAFDALQEFLRLYGYEAIQTAAGSIPPAIFENLRDYEPAAEAIEPFRETFRRTWLITQRRFQIVSRGVNLLNSKGIDTMLLKGSALIASGYRLTGARVMEDVDCLVPLGQAHQARQVLLDGGWKTHLLPGGDPQHMLQMVHGACFTKDRIGSIDLHWHAFIECLDEHDDDSLWEAAVPVEIAGVATKSPHPSDMLLHVITHGARFNEPRILQWVLDADAIIRKQGEAFDWERLISQSRRTGHILEMEASLTYLREELETPVPEHVLDILRTEKTSFLDRLNFRGQNLPDSTFNLIQRDFASYLKRSRKRPLGERLRGVVWHLQATREIDSPLKVPGQMLYRLYLRMRRKAPPKTSATSIEGSSTPSP